MIRDKGYPLYVTYNSHLCHLKTYTIVGFVH